MATLFRKKKEFVLIAGKYSGGGTSMSQKGTPPVAGAIQWARSIFYRVKKPILSFKSMPHLL